MKKQTIITKSAYLNALKCPKLLWIDRNDKKRIPPPNASQQRIFDQGSEVGELAKKLYPGGIDVPYAQGMFFENIEETRKLLSSRKVLFEAGILEGDIYSRVDILKPSGRDKWDIIEVKSSAGMNEIYLHDIAFQKHCCEKSGLKIDRCFLLHINNQYVKCGEIDPAGFFEEHEVTGEIDAYIYGIEGRIDKMRKTISREACPEIEIGPYCKEPYECAMIPECWKDLPEDNIFTLYNYGPKKAFPLYKAGIKTIRDMPEAELGPKQIIQKKCEETGKIYIDKTAIGEFLRRIRYPVCFMDFETINPGIPFFDGTRPYQRIPFQFSAHIRRSPGGETEHYGFLAKDARDPRERLLLELERVLGTDGTVMVYNRGFEESVLGELGEVFPEHRTRINGIQGRIIDLLEPFRGFSYYVPSQRGSASMKKVLPAVTGKGYEDMDIAAGGDASALYFYATYGAGTPEERDKIYSDLEKYCALDTEGMVWLLDEVVRSTGYNSK